MDDIVIVKWLTGIVATLFTGFFAKFIWDRHKKVDALENRVIVVEGEMVTEKQVRALLAESNASLRGDFREEMNGVKNSISENTQTMNLVLQELSRQKGYEEARKEFEVKQ